MCLALPGLILSITTQPGPGQLLKQSEFDLQANGEDFPAGSDRTARASTAESAVPAPCHDSFLPRRGLTSISTILYSTLELEPIKGYVGYFQ